jgi:hypothetical protein
MPVQAEYGLLDQEYGLANFRRYNREYAGSLKDGTRYVFCNMHVYPEGETPPANRFTVIIDGATACTDGRRRLLCGTSLGHRRSTGFLTGQIISKRRRIDLVHRALRSWDSSRSSRTSTQ